MADHGHYRDRLLLPLLLTVPLIGCSGPWPQPDRSESILDRVVHLEEEVHFEIPEVPRLCDSVDLTVRRIDVGDCELYVADEGSGTPLVLINGGPGGTHHYFHPWFTRAARFARVIYYDQRGCGISDYEPGEDGYSVEQAVADLDAIRAALGIERWVLLGYSYGGFLAQYYATIHADRVAGLVLLGASPGMSVEGGSRQREFISDAEQERIDQVRTIVRERAEAEGWSVARAIALSLYNSFLNGDWKRQHFYRPSRERIAQIARYEWVFDAGFNSIMGVSQSRVDLAGVFEGCPIPTLILEGEYDLTWNEQKPRALLDNHPGAELVVIENAAHGIYDEQPDRFFTELERFIRGLPEVPPTGVDAWSEGLADWHAAIAAEQRSPLERYGWDQASSERLAADYDRGWLEQFPHPMDLLRIGFALYDVRQYEEALRVFVQLEESMQVEVGESWAGMAVLWQGHLLDLLGRRQEALELYRRVADLGIDEEWRHDQYGMRYRLSPYAAERIQTPFERIENRNPGDR